MPEFGRTEQPVHVVDLARPKTVRTMRKQLLPFLIVVQGQGPAFGQLCFHNFLTRPSKLWEKLR